MKAVIFGSIGTLVETSDIQRQSFNKAFKTLGLDWYWSKDNYKNLLKKSGGANRVNYFSNLKKKFVDSKKVREIKTLFFNNYLKNNFINPRDGVLEVIEYAKFNNIKIGLASTTSIENIDAIFKTLNKKIEKKDFDFIGNNELIKKVKPEPDIYIKALNDLGVNRDECIAIEDSLDSALSAFKAKVECIAFPGLFHVDDDFSFCKKCLNKLDISIFEN
ncbi:MAG: phosphatase [Pelagibacteraceae bacterium]|nr:MAG: phosphatase [Pelagibacteraceae bacterium]